MTKPDYVYVTYIKTTPEKLWQALLDPEMTKLFWGHHRNVSDWQPGSRWEHRDYADESLVDIVGKVLESLPPNRLVLSWADPVKASDPAAHSRLTFELQPFEDSVRLTVTHEQLDDEMHAAVSMGWPAVLSSLKTLMETGQPIVSTTRRWGG
ncbi:MAG: SRPBCC family protein [Gemmataceae bacterium]